MEEKELIEKINKEFPETVGCKLYMNGIELTHEVGSKCLDMQKLQAFVNNQLELKEFVIYYVDTERVYAADKEDAIFHARNKNRLPIDKILTKTN